MKKNNASIFVFGLAALLMVLPACNKLSKSTYNPSSPDSVVIKNNVFVVDSTVYTLVSTASQLSSGTYVYSYGASLPAMRHNGDFASGSIMIGITGEGYLRKITSVTADAQTIVVNSQQARLEDVFEQGRISFSTGFAGWNALGGDFHNNLTSQVLYANSAATIRVSGSAFYLNPTWNYNLQFTGGQLANFSATCPNSNLQAYLPLSISSYSSTVFNASDTFYATSGTNWVWVGTIPVLITTDICLVANVSGNINGPVNNSVLINNISQFSGSTTYSGGAWQNTFTCTPTSSASGTIAAGGSENTVTCNIVPTMNVRFYGVTGSSVGFGLNTNMTGNYASATSDWDFKAAFYLQPGFNAYQGILGYSVPNFSVTYNADSADYYTPYTLVKYSGDNQTGAPGQYLAAPIIVKVTDSRGIAQPGVKVYFKVATGGGSLSYYDFTTDAAGYASANWELGGYAGAQTVTATARKGDESAIMGAPVTFTAN